MPWIFHQGSFANLREGSIQTFTDALVLAVSNLVLATQTLLPDLKANKGYIMVTGGGLALENEGSVKTGVEWGVANLAIAKAAQRKAVNLLNVDLAKDEVYVVELTVCGVVQGTAFDPEAKGPLTKEQCAEAYWDLYAMRDYSVWHKILA